MKHAFLLLLISIFAYRAMGQAGSLTVQNNTSCWVYYRIQGGPVCPSYIVSGNVISLAPGGVVNYPNSAAIPGFPAGPLYLLGNALVYDKPAACVPSAPWRIGEPCTGMNSSYKYPIYRPNCAGCLPSITAQWIPAPAPGGLATLIFF